MLLLFVACASAPEGSAVPTSASAKSERPAGCAETAAVTWDNWGHGFFLTYCDSCHAAGASNRNGAPADVVFDNAAQVSSWKSRIYSRVLDEGTMPIGGGVYDADLQLLRVLLVCDR